MNFIKILINWLSIISLTTSCQGLVKINDAEWCGDMGRIGAECDMTFTDKRRSLDKATWDKERVGQLCTDSKNVANLKAAILKMCGDTGMCTQEVMDYVESATARVGVVAAIAMTAKGGSKMKTLKIGDSGEEFQELRKLLLLSGFSTADEDSFQQYTFNMVSAFQKEIGLKQDGIVGPKTWELLGAKTVDVSLKSPWMKSMISKIGEPFKTGSPPTAFNREVFSHTDIKLKDVMLSGCSATVCWALEINGFKSTHDAWAESYKNYGVPCDLIPGAIVLIRHNTGRHHVTCCYELISLVKNYEAGKFLGGNQNGKLQISTYSFDPLGDQIVAIRKPILA